MDCPNGTWQIHFNLLIPQQNCPGFKAIMMSVLVAGNGFRGRIWSPKNPRFNIESIFKPSDLFTLPFLLSMPMKTRQLYHQIEGVVYLVPLTKANEVTLKSPSQFLIDPY